MAQLVISAAGAAVGFMVGGPTGAQVGWAIGGALGGVLFKPDAPDQPAPQIMDLRVTGTEYGQPIPYIRGKMRTAGQMIWNSNRRPRTVTTSSGGGKGGAPETESSQVLYGMDMLYLLADNEGVGIARVWNNGKLVWTNDSGATSESRAASNETGHWERITFYSGAADQLPDPEYETAVGAANAVAYRGRSTVFISSFQLGPSGQVPNLSFELVADGTIGAGLTSEILYEELSANGADGVAYQNGRVFYPMGTAAVLVIDADDGSLLGTITLSHATFNPIVADPVSGYIWCWTASRLFRLLDTGSLDATITGVSQTGLVYNKNNGDLWRTISGGTMRKIDKATGANTGSAITAWYDITFDAAGNTWQTDGGTKTLRKITTGNVTTTYTVTTAATYLAWIVYDPDRDSVWLLCGGASTHELVEFSLVSLDVVQTLALPATTVDLAFQWLRYEPVHNRLWFASSVTDDVHVVDAATATMLGTVGYDAETMAGPAAFNEDGCAYFPGFTTGFATTTVREFCYSDPSITAICPTLQDVQSEICLRAGMSAGQFDVTALSSITKDVCSFSWSHSPAREPTELLMSSHFYEMTMSDKIYFIPRGGSAVATIPYLDLGASMGDDQPDPLALKQMSDLEIPAQIALTYINIDDDYQTDTQLSDRLISSTAGTVQAVQMALGMTPSEAKAIADTMLLDMTASMVGTNTALLGDYTRLEPTDPIVVTGADGSTFRMRLVKKTDSYPLLTYEAVLDDASVLTSQGITSADYTPQTVVVAPPDTVMELLDIPILQDFDDDSGFYVAAKGDGDPWPGAAIVSSPNDVTYTRKATVSESGVLGECTTILGDWTGPRVIDELNSVTVDVGDGVLESSTRDAVLDDQTINAVLVGSEVLQFITATIVTTGIYTLTRLLRGGRGTEWAMVDHVASERFVLLRNAGMRRIVLQNNELGVEKYYKGVTLDRALSTADAVLFANNAIGLKPFSPFDLRATRDGSNNITFTWQRRTRLSTRMIGALGISVPLGEETEAYEVDVYDDNSPAVLLRTIPSSTTTVDYLASEQTADGITPGDSVTWNVRMISQTVGRGYESLEAYA